MKPKKGCGCLLVAVGACLVALGLFIVVVSYVADNEAGEENQQEWVDYQAAQPTIDSLRQIGVPDSVLHERYPAPHIRQGGFFFLFGGAFAFGIIVVAVIPLLVGLLLLRKS